MSGLEKLAYKVFASPAEEFAAPRSISESCRVLRNWGYWITLTTFPVFLVVVTFTNGLPPGSKGRNNNRNGWRLLQLHLQATHQECALKEVQKRLVPLPSDQDSPAHPEPIRWLRRYSNYLTPQKGLLTGDTWVAVAIWFRNTFLNQLILISILFLLLHLPNLVAPYLIQKSDVGFVPAAVILFLLALASVTYTLWHEYDRITGGPPAPSKNGFARKGFL